MKIRIYLIVPLCLGVLGAAPAAMAETRAFFSPGSNIQATIVDQISRSSHSIDAMACGLSAKRIASALVYAKTRGLKVRVIADKSQSRAKNSYIGFLISKGVPVRLLSGRKKGLMHNTLGIFDGNTLITGSFNWTNDSAFYNFENVIMTDDNALVQEYKEEFDKLWSDGRK